MSVKKQGRFTLRIFGFVSLIAVGLVVLVYINPNPAFACAHRYRGFTVGSDRPISPSIDNVLDDAIKRLGTSPLYHDGEQFKLYICNNRRRLGFLVFNTSIGGGAVYGTRNIFVREADIDANKIISPSGEPLLDAQDRPMSYFIANEATHIMQFRRYEELATLQSPFWLVEGYADYIGKGGNFNLAANRKLLNMGDRLLSEELGHHGLYRRYHLMVAAQLQRPGVTIDSLFAAPPSEAEALRVASTP